MKIHIPLVLKIVLKNMSILICCQHMGGFAQFGLNQFKRGKKRFSQRQISLDTDKLKKCNFVKSLQGGVY